jgi:hypothetical protein
MGKQINFYFDQDTELKLAEFMLSYGYVFLYGDVYKKKLTIIQTIDELNKDANIIHLYRSDLGQVYIDKLYDYEIDYIKSPVIEFTRTTVKYDKKIITRGRLWVETRYFDKDNIQVNKNPELAKDFNKFIRWIKKNIPQQCIMVGDNNEYIVKEYLTDKIKELLQAGFKLA